MGNFKSGQKKLSVITVCYNEKEIERTCRSIAGQKCQDFEWIVIDGGSTDGTLEILQRYKERIDKLVSEPDKGVFDAMNKGIKLAHGEWLNFMNGGDLFANDEVVGEFLRREANADGAGVIYADFYVVYDDGQRRLRTFDGQPLDKKFFYGDCIGHQASFIRRELFDKYGLYNDAHRIVSDWEKWIEFAENGVAFRYEDFTAADFYYNGISSKMTPKHAAERGEVIAAHFSKEEIAACEATKYCRRTAKLFGVLPLWTFKRKTKGTRIDILLFGFLPLYKITQKHGKAKHYLFGVLPWLVIKDKN